VHQAPLIPSFFSAVSQSDAMASCAEVRLTRPPADGGVQGVLHLVFRVRRARVLGPQVRGVVAAAKFQRDEVVKLGPL
jgi:hypothetical protein